MLANAISVMLANAISVILAEAITVLMGALFEGFSIKIQTGAEDHEKNENQERAGVQVP